jgi:hypothetical protein
MNDTTAPVFDYNVYHDETELDHWTEMLSEARAIAYAWRLVHNVTPRVIRHQTRPTADGHRETDPATFEEIAP